MSNPIFGERWITIGSKMRLLITTFSSQFSVSELGTHPPQGYSPEHPADSTFSCNFVSSFSISESATRYWDSIAFA